MRSRIFFNMMVKKLLKRKYELKLARRAVDVRENREFIMKCLKKEWEEIERSMERDRKKQKRYETMKEVGTVLGLTILGMVAVCGVLVVAAVAPNVFSAFGRLGRHRRYFDRKDFQARANYLKQRGYVDIKKSKDEITEIRLTEHGRAQIVKRSLGNLKIAPQKKWDRMWRIVIFDIPEKNKWARDGLRRSLKNMGFYRLQKSTFIFPYPCREEIEFLSRLYGVGDYLRFIETSTINFDGDLKNFFNPT